MEKEYRNIKHIAELIFAELKGTISPAEQQELNRWKEESPDHQELCRQYLSTDFLARKFRFIEENNAGDAYREFEQKVTRRERRRKIRLYRYAAAAVILLLATGSGLLFHRHFPDEPMLTAEQILPGCTKAILTLENGKQVDISEKNYMAYIANEIPEATHRGEGQEAADTTAFHSITIPRGGEYALTLGDGSRLWMNSESEIRIPVHFAASQREVYMKGEIFFDIARDTSCPFIVNTTQSSIRVMGTSFNIKDYQDEDFLEATLVTGNIVFHHSGNNACLLPGEQLRLDKKNGQTFITKVDAQQYCAWKNGRFVFEKQRLEDIMNTIARWYNIRVFYENPSLKEILFTGNMKRYEDLGQVIDLLKMINRIGIEVNGDQVVIKEYK